MRQPPNVETHGNTLLQLPHLGRGESIAQLWLPDQDHLEKFAAFRLEIGEHTQLFKDTWFKILGFINQHHSVTASGELVEQILIQGIDVSLPRCLSTGHSKIARNSL
jgi:hypothetical protein